MDFKSLISKLDSMDAPPKTPAAPTIDKAVQLNEDAQLRVLSGRTTYVAEAKKKAEEDKEMKTGDEKPSSTGGTIEKTATGVKHHAGKNYSGKAAEKEETSKKDESIEPQFKSKFMKMVEAKKDEADKKKLPSMSHIKKMCEKKMSVAEICEMHPDCDRKELKQMIADCKKQMDESRKRSGDDKTGDGKTDFDDIQVARMTAGGVPKKTAIAKATSDKFKEAVASKTESKMMPKGKKRPVKESVETKLSFKQMVQLVQESGGQQQIDPVDKALFTWAERVAKNKLGEGMKADLYAGLVYERNGGVFEMYDVLSEDRR